MAGWQDWVKNGRIKSVAFGAAALAFPTPIPSIGGNLDFSDSASGGATAGWTGDSFKVNADDFAINPVDNRDVLFHPPNCPVPVGRQVTAVGIRTVQFKSFEIQGGILTLLGNTTTASEVTTESTTFTRAAFILEWEGLGALYFPSVEVQGMPPEGGLIRESAKPLDIQIFGTQALPIGYQQIEYSA